MNGIKVSCTLALLSSFLCLWGCSVPLLEDVAAVEGGEGPCSRHGTFWCWTSQLPEPWEINLNSLSVTSWLYFAWSSMNGLRHKVATFFLLCWEGSQMPGSLKIETHKWQFSRIILFQKWQWSRITFFSLQLTLTFNFCFFILSWSRNFLIGLKTCIFREKCVSGLAVIQMLTWPPVWNQHTNVPLSSHRIVSIITPAGVLLWLCALHRHATDGKIASGPRNLPLAYCELES